MADAPQLIYLEPDDEITSVVRRLRAAESSSVVIVAPGRSRATSSAVALRLLARVASDEARTLALVADTGTRALAAEAGIPGYASVAEATSGIPATIEASEPVRAPIHVVRGIADPAPGPLAALGSAEETMAVRLPPPVKPGGASGRSRRLRIPRWPWLVALLVLALGAGAAVLPGATVTISPAVQEVGPEAYQLRLPIAGHAVAELRVTRPGTATGTRSDLVAATGSVTFFNWSLVAQPVAQGTQVSVGGTIAFATVERIVVQRARISGGGTITPGQGNVGVAAVIPGPAGNVAAGAIDTIDDTGVRSALRGSPDNPNSLVTNLEPTAGGLETPHSVIQQSDVDTLVAAIQADLASQLAEALAAETDRLYAGPPASEVPQIEIQPDLVGTEDLATFELTGTLAFDRPYVARTDVQAAATAALGDDPTAVPGGTTVLAASIATEIGTATANGNEMTIAVSVRAAAAAAIDAAAVRDRVAGLTVAEAQAALADLGEVDVDLWPGWVDRLPRLTFRIGVETVAPSPRESAGESAGP